MNNLDKKIEHNINGIKKIIGIFYGDTDVNYQIDLFNKSKEKYMNKFKSNMIILDDIKQSQFEALQSVYTDLYKISNIR